MRTLFPVLLLFLSAGLPVAGTTQVATPGQVTGQVNPPPAAARARADIAALIAALKLDDALKAMRSEGLAYGETLESDLFPGRGGAGWQRVLQDVYAVDAMHERLLPALEREFGRLPEADLATARTFFESPFGQRIVTLENAARLAQLDEDVKIASQQAAEELSVTDPARLALLHRFIAANDLIDSNVVGALNANAAFYFGLNAAGAFDEPLSDADVLSDVASQEEGIREETADWMDAYLALAYKPLSDADLETYLAFSESGAGRALSRAMFAAYDTMFTGISRDLGQGAARFIASQEL